MTGIIEFASLWGASVRRQRLSMALFSGIIFKVFPSKCNKIKVY